MKSSNVTATVEQLDDAINYVLNRQDAAVQATADAVSERLAAIVQYVTEAMRAVAAATEHSARGAELARVVGALEAGGHLTVVQNVLPATTTKTVVRDDRGQIAQIVEVSE